MGRGLRGSPITVDRSRVVCEWHFAPETLSQPGLDPSEGVALWDETNRQDWHICELSQQGVSSRAYVPGLYSKQESLLAEARAEVARGGTPAVTIRRRGDVVTELLAVADELAPDLVVVGSRGRGPLTAALLGSVSVAVAGQASAPVLVVGPTSVLGEGPIIVGVDGSETSLDAGRVAAALDRGLGRGLQVVHAYMLRPIPGASAVPEARKELAAVDEQRAEELLAAAATELGVPRDATRTVRNGTEPAALLELAGDLDATLLVVGSRGRGAVRAALLGSFSLSILADSPCPVVVVPPGARAPASG